MKGSNIFHNRFVTHAIVKFFININEKLWESLCMTTVKKCTRNKKLFIKYHLSTYFADESLHNKIWV